MGSALTLICPVFICKAEASSHRLGQGPRASALHLPLCSPSSLRPALPRGSPETGHLVERSERSGAYLKSPARPGLRWLQKAGGGMQRDKGRRRLKLTWIQTGRPPSPRFLPPVPSRPNAENIGVRRGCGQGLWRREVHREEKEVRSRGQCSRGEEGDDSFASKHSLLTSKR